MNNFLIKSQMHNFSNFRNLIGLEQVVTEDFNGLFACSKWSKLTKLLVEALQNLTMVVK